MQHQSLFTHLGERHQCTSGGLLAVRPLSGLKVDLLVEGQPGRQLAHPPDCQYLANAAVLSRNAFDTNVLKESQTSEKQGPRE